MHGLRQAIRDVICEEAIGIEYPDLYASRDAWLQDHDHQEPDDNQIYQYNVDAAVTVILKIFDESQTTEGE